MPNAFIFSSKYFFEITRLVTTAHIIFLSDIVLESK